MAVAVTLATPAALVTAVPLDKVALGPTVDTVNVTVTPLTRLPSASFTVACNAIGNAVPAPADCGVPPVAVRNAYVVLVNENVAVNV